MVDKAVVAPHVVVSVAGAWVLLDTQAQEWHVVGQGARSAVSQRAEELHSTGRHDVLAGLLRREGKRVVLGGANDPLARLSARTQMPGDDFAVELCCNDPVDIEQAGWREALGGLLRAACRAELGSVELRIPSSLGVVRMSQAVDQARRAIYDAGVRVLSIRQVAVLDCVMSSAQREQLVDSCAWMFRVPCSDLSESVGPDALGQMRSLADSGALVYAELGDAVGRTELNSEVMRACSYGPIDLQHEAVVTPAASRAEEVLRSVTSVGACLLQSQPFRRIVQVVLTPPSQRESWHSRLAAILVDVRGQAYLSRAHLRAGIWQSWRRLVVQSVHGRNVIGSLESDLPDCDKCPLQAVCAGYWSPGFDYASRMGDLAGAAEIANATCAISMRVIEHVFAVIAKKSEEVQRTVLHYDKQTHSIAYDIASKEVGDGW